MTLLIPFYALYASLMCLPDFYRLIGGFYGPVIYFRLGGSSQELVVLPSDVDYLTWLVELVHWIFLKSGWVPNLDVGLVAPRRHQGVRLVPTGSDQGRLGLVNSLKLAVQVPNPRDVVVSRSQQFVAVVAPLNRRDVMVLISPFGLLRDVALVHADVTELLEGVQ